MKSNMLSHECWYLHIATSQTNIIVIFSTVTKSIVNLTIYLQFVLLEFGAKIVQLL
jgi:hypothetical protein